MIDSDVDMAASSSKSLPASLSFPEKPDLLPESELLALGQKMQQISEKRKWHESGELEDINVDILQCLTELLVFTALKNSVISPPGLIDAIEIIESFTPDEIE
jgi:hypothetical protein